MANCVHGIDSRFCSVCNRGLGASRGRVSSGDVTLDEILRFLNDQQIRATYGAVAEVLGVAPRGLGTLLGSRRPEASWVVNASNGLPTDYTQDESHPSLLASADVISTGRALILRLAAWRGAREP